MGGQVDHISRGLSLTSYLVTRCAVVWAVRGIAHLAHVDVLRPGNTESNRKRIGRAPGRTIGSSTSQRRGDKTSDWHLVSPVRHVSVIFRASYRQESSLLVQPPPPCPGLQSSNSSVKSPDLVDSGDTRINCWCTEHAHWSKWSNQRPECPLDNDDTHLAHGADV
jgi:hypothetical protein